MGVISVVLNEIDQHHLEQEHAALVSAWPTLGHKTWPPTFATWLGSRMARSEGGVDEGSLGDVRVFNAIETLIASLPQHGFALGHTAAPGTDPAASSRSLAQAMVTDYKLQPVYTKRLQELFAHYQKSGKEVADAAQVGITNRAYGALTEAHRQLTKRTTDAIARLGADKAIGRVEGATSILVSLQVMDPTMAKKRTSAFKAEARAVRKPGWVGKIFGEP